MHPAATKNMQKQHDNRIRQKLLRALFAKAHEKGISVDDLRGIIAPNIIKKRLSKASPQEIMRMLDHITGNSPFPLFGKEGDKRGRYDSSRSGLIQELEDIARARWGQGFEKSLNRFVNANRKSPTHYRFLRVADLKGIKERIREMNRKDGIA